MNDLEERLRTDLATAVEPIEADPNLEMIIAAGESDLRGRRRRGAISAFAVAAVVALIAYVGLAPRAVSGTPAPIGTVSAGVPATPATQDSGDDHSAVLNVLNQYQTGSVTYTDAGQVTTRPITTSQTPASVEVRLTANSGVEFTLTTVGGAQTTVQAKQVPGGLVQVEPVPGLLVGVVFAQVDWLEAWNSVGDKSNGWLQQEPFGDQYQYEAFAQAYADDAAGASSVTGYVWQDAHGVHDSQGRKVTWTRLRVGSEDGVLYLDPSGAGVSFPSFPGGADGARVDFGKGLVFDGSASMGNGSSPVSNQGIGVLPDGASRPTPHWRDGTSKRRWSTTTLGGHVVFVAGSSEARSSRAVTIDGGLASITYQDADGRTVTRSVT